MAIVQISKIQQRRGLQQDLPQLASGEIGWSIDTRRIYIGNGTLDEGSPAEGKTEILTEFSIINYTNTFSSNIAILQGNVVTLQSNIATLNSQITALQTSTGTTSNTAILVQNTSGIIAGFAGNNGVISYNLQQGTAQRTGQIRYSYSNSTVGYDEEYVQDATTACTLTMTANSSMSTLNYNTTGASTITSLTYQVKTI